jgi:cytochrome c-type biogenesis protein CcmE
MRKFITKAMIPALFAVGSLGLGAAFLAAPAGATTPPKHAPAGAISASATYKGTIKTTDAAKTIFTLKDGSKTYTVFYRGAVKFTKGSAASLKVGTTVSVTGNLVKSKSLLHATSIKA